MKESVIRVIFIFSSCLVLFAAIEWSKQFLTFYHPIQSNHYLFEGWLQAQDVESGVAQLMGNDAAEVFVVGKKYDSLNTHEIVMEPIVLRKQGILLLTNSSLMLKDEYIPVINTSDKIAFAVEARGGVLNGIHAHFILIVNGRKVASFFSSSSLQIFSTLISCPHGIESIGLYYDNDAANQDEGRFLTVKSIQIGNKTISLDQENVIVTKQVNTLLTGFPSSAERMKTYMEDLGLDGERIQAIAFNESEINQTLAGARCFNYWPGSAELRSMNVWSHDIHSRRSWMTYQHLLGSKTEVGVVYMQHNQDNSQFSKNWWNQIPRVVDELFSYFGNWFYLNFVNKDSNLPDIK